MLAFGCYWRYAVIEQASVGIACEATASGWLCGGRRTILTLAASSLFGLVALGAAALNLLRPSPVLCAIALAAGGTGIVLYNVVLSAFAVALLILSLARPAPQPD
jgi:hypothetical protein